MSGVPCMGLVLSSGTRTGPSWRTLAQEPAGALFGACGRGPLDVPFEPFRRHGSPLVARAEAVKGGRCEGPAWRGDNQDEVRQAKLARSSRCKSGPGKG